MSSHQDEEAEKSAAAAFSNLEDLSKKELRSLIRGMMMFISAEPGICAQVCLHGKQEFLAIAKEEHHRDVSRAYDFLRQGFERFQKEMTDGKIQKP